MEKVNSKKRWIIIQIFMLCLLPITSCTKQKETVYVYHEEPVYISVGESAAFPLENIPEGKTAADFTWTITGDTAEIHDGIVTGIQTHPSYLSGKETANAELIVGNKRYSEVFNVVVEKNIESIQLNYPSYTLLKGEEITITYKTDPKTLSKGQRVVWDITDEEIAELTEVSDPNKRLVLKALNPGSTELVIKTGGAEASSKVYVFDEPSTANEKLRYLCARQDSFSEAGELNGSINEIEIPVSEIPQLGTNGSGKYMVIWECDYNKLPGSSYTEFDWNTKEDCSYTAALPLEIRPDTWEEVEYIIRVKADYMQVGTYESGIRAMLNVVKITKESIDGEVIEELDQIQGDIPNEIYIDKSMTPSPEAYYGSLPDKSRAEASLSAILKELR